MFLVECFTVFERVNVFVAAIFYFCSQSWLFCTPSIILELIPALLLVILLFIFSTSLIYLNRTEPSCFSAQSTAIVNIVSVVRPIFLVHFFFCVFDLPGSFRDICSSCLICKYICATGLVISMVVLSRVTSFFFFCTSWWACSVVLFFLLVYLEAYPFVWAVKPLVFLFLQADIAEHYCLCLN